MQLSALRRAALAQMAKGMPQKHRMTCAATFTSWLTSCSVPPNFINKAAQISRLHDKGLHAAAFPCWIARISGADEFMLPVPHMGNFCLSSKTLRKLLRSERQTYISFRRCQSCANWKSQQGSVRNQAIMWVNKTKIGCFLTTNNGS